MADIWRLSATEIATAVREGTLSATAVTEAHLDRLSQVNPPLNAVVQDCADEALETARILDKRIAEGDEFGPLAGVPVTIKVNVDQQGYATTNGATIFRDLVAQSDSPVVSNLRKAGAVIVGRTNTPAFSLRWFTRNELHGQTLNPRDARITPGGSSGGAAASVASGICAIAHGTDIAGSIRYPAYACGLQGLRPTLGRVPAYNATGADRHIGGQLMAVSGPIARSIADLRLGLTAMMPADPHDPWSVPAPLDLGTYPKKVALDLSPDDMPVAPEIRAALRHAADCLTNAGWQVDETRCPPMRPAAAINEQLWMAEMRHGLGDLVEQEADPDSLFVYRQMTARAAPVDLNDLLTALQSRVTLLRTWLEFLHSYPVVLCPVSGSLPFAQQLDVSSAAAFETIMEAQLTQRALPTLGLPGLTVTTGSVGTIPVGVQLIGGRYREDILLDAGAAIEKASPPILVSDPT